MRSLLSASQHFSQHAHGCPPTVASTKSPENFLSRVAFLQSRTLAQLVNSLCSGFRTPFAGNQVSILPIASTPGSACSCCDVQTKRARRCITIRTQFSCFDQTTNQGRSQSPRHRNQLRRAPALIRAYPETTDDESCYRGKRKII